MSKEAYNCPYCGSESLWLSGGYPTPSGKALLKRRKCGSLIDPMYPANEERSELCREREARQKAEKIVKAQEDELNAISDALGTNEGHSSVDHIVALKSENKKLIELFAHCHLNDEGSDRCGYCGLDLRHEIHRRF